MSALSVQTNFQSTLRKSVLTILRSCDMSQDAEGLGLQVGSATGPFRHLRLLIVRFDYGLVHWRSTIHKRVFNRKWATPKQREKGKKKQDQSFICVLWICVCQIITNDYIIAFPIIIIKDSICWIDLWINKETFLYYASCEDVHYFNYSSILVRDLWWRKWLKNELG